jgi:hypothetical protein
MGRPVGLVGGAVVAGGDDGAGRDAGGAAGPETGGADDAAGALGRAGGGGAGRAGGAEDREGAGGGIDTSLAGRLVTRRGLAVGSRPAAGADGVVVAGVRAAGALGAGSCARAAGDSATGVRSAAGGAEASAALAGASSGCTGRRRPSLSALRRTRSAWASSIDEEWLFTPMPNDNERSSASLFVRPSSRASS